MSLIKKVSESSSDEFFKKCEEMKVKRNSREIDPLFGLLSKTQGDERTKYVTRRETASKSSENTASQEKRTFQLNGHVSQKETQKQALSISVSRKKSLEKRTVPLGIYSLPSWVRERPYLSWNFVPEISSFNFVNSGPIGVLPPNVQESRFIDDILFCLVGIDGDYVNSKKLLNIESENKGTFNVDPSANEALKLLVQNILPMFSYYSTIINFVEENMHYERGLVNHALSAAIRTYLKDYFVLVSQLENQHLQHNLTLQRLWFYLQPSMATMETIASIVTELSKSDWFGGNVLSVLHENTASLTGSNKSSQIYHSLTRAASLPYFEILEKWIYKGIILDCYSEFMVQDNEQVAAEPVKNDDQEKCYLPEGLNETFWDMRYTLRRNQIPTFLSEVAVDILRTGKYLNVVRQSGKTVNYPDARTLVYTMRESQYTEFIKPAYHFASQKLLDLLMNEMDLKGRLLSVKHYFLLDQGDFLIQFMDIAEEELQKNTADIVCSSIESLLDLAIRTSVVNVDKYTDDLSFQLCNMDFMTQLFKILKVSSLDVSSEDATEPGTLTGFEAFAFTYDIKWPLSLVLNRKALVYYQILFRHLFYIKRIENLLGRLWSFNKRTKSLPRSEIFHFISAFALRQKMLNFVQSVDYYLTLEVIEPNWNEFWQGMHMANNVDELITSHSDFLEKCMMNCMLYDTKFLLNLASLLKLCIEFSAFLQDVMKSSVDLDASFVGDSMLFSTNEAFTETLQCPASLEHFQQQIYSFEKKFDEGIFRMLDILHDNTNHSKEASKIIDMWYRLDFNVLEKWRLMRASKNLPSLM